MPERLLARKQAPAPNSTCNEGLTCASGVCVALPASDVDAFAGVDSAEAYDSIPNDLVADDSLARLDPVSVDSDDLDMGPDPDHDHDAAFVGDMTQNDEANELPDVPCSENARECIGAFVRVCLGGVWQKLLPACELGCQGGVCNACEPGLKTCAGKLLQVCNSDGQGQTVLKQCEGDCLPDKLDCGCLPTCGGNVCGPDGCGGTCGICPGFAPYCYQAQCLGTCPAVPVVPGQLAKVSAIEIPTDEEVIRQSCEDLDGDGFGDNGLRPLAKTLGTELSKLAVAGELPLVLGAVGIDNYQNQMELVFRLYSGKGVGPLAVYPEADKFDADCTPYATFDSASIVDGKLIALSPVLDGAFVPMFLALGKDAFTPHVAWKKARFVGSVAGSSSVGLVLTSGLLTGLVPKAEVDQAISTLEHACTQPSPPQICSYLPTLKTFLPMLYDVDTDGDGTKDAGSICMFVNW